jgi:hypothetical protein
MKPARKLKYGTSIMIWGMLAVFPQGVIATPPDDDPLFVVENNDALRDLKDPTLYQVKRGYGGASTQGEAQ